MALQHRWLTPLLLDNDPSNFVTLWLRAYLLSLSPLSITDARLPFLFPSFRKGPLAMNSPGALSVLFRSFDALFDSGTIFALLNGFLSERLKVSVETCLSLPSSEAISWPTDGSPRAQKPYKFLQVSHVFCLSLDHSRLIPKEWVNGQRQPSQGRNRIRKLVQLLLAGQLILHHLCLPGGAMTAVPSSLSEVCGQLVHP